MAQGFGATAQEWAARLPLTLNLVTSDFQHFAVSMAFVAKLKRDGKTVAASAFLPDLRVKTAASMAAQIVDNVADPDERFNFFNALTNGTLVVGGQPQNELVKYDSSAIGGMQEFIHSCDVWVTRSYTETQRTRKFLTSVAAHIVCAAPIDPAVPAPPSRANVRDRIVVWAPDADRGECALFAQALEPLRIPVSIVCARPGLPLPRLHAELCGAEVGAEVLSRALAIVDGSFYDPGTARALAAYGVPLATAWISGAHEWVSPVQTYEPWSTRSIYDAALTALGSALPRATRIDDGSAEIESALRSVVDVLPTGGPLVSVIIPTYNRRHWLPIALKSVAGQTYRNIEIIVVNDGGDDVSDLVVAVPNLRLMENERNSGVTFSINAGIAAATGRYIALLADDDLLYHDHIARLVAALEQSGMSVAHSNALVAHFNIGPGGVNVLRGHHLGSPRPTLLDDILIRNQISGPGVMFRRSVFLNDGYFDDEFRHGCDFDMWMRLSRRHDFAFVNHATVQVSMRNDTSQLSSESGERTARLLEAIYARHPVTGRPGLEALRRQQVTHIAAQPVFTCSPTQELSDADRAELSRLDALPVMAVPTVRIPIVATASD